MGAVLRGESAPGDNRRGLASRPAVHLLCHVPWLPAKVLCSQYTPDLCGVLDLEKAAKVWRGASAWGSGAGLPAHRTQDAIHLGVWGLVQLFVVHRAIPAVLIQK